VSFFVSLGAASVPRASVGGASPSPVSSGPASSKTFVGSGGSLGDELCVHANALAAIPIETTRTRMERDESRRTRMRVSCPDLESGFLPPRRDGESVVGHVTTSNERATTSDIATRVPNLGAAW
jgi:hypothetical protein